MAENGMCGDPETARGGKPRMGPVGGPLIGLLFAGGDCVGV